MKHIAASFVFSVTAAIAMAQPQPLNSGFETWQNLGTGTEEPEEWSSLKTSDGGTFVNNFAPQVCWQSSDAHTGSFSVNVRTVTSLIGAANGIVTCGRVHAELDPANGRVFTEASDPQWHQALTSRPDSLVGWYKTTVMTDDYPTVDAIIHTGAASLPENGTLANWVAAASWDGPSATVGEWTRFSVPFNYASANAPEYFLMVLTSGDSLISQIGTQSWYDDIALMYNVTCTPSVSTVLVSESATGSVDVTYSTGGIPVGPTTFTVELSDAIGDFSSPTVIGTVVSSSETGSIPCSVPAGTPAGADYAIRVVTDSPFYAPVGCAVSIEVSTGLDAAQSALRGICVQGDRLLIYVNHEGEFECFAADGRMVLADRLSPGTNEIELQGNSGVLLVRVIDGQRLTTTRVLVP